MSEFLTIAEASGLIAAKKLSPVELTKICLDRVKQHDGALHAFITLTEERALADAAAAETAIARDGPKGPLHGIPIGIKDIINTKGILTTAHSRWLEHNVPDTDATVTARLAAAGTVLMGKLATHEFADGGPSFDLPWPAPRNPWNTDHFTAGSSSGTGVAVAAGMILGGLGTDTGGSIRGPSALCGIAGIKPTYGLVSRAGVLPAAFSLDHIGPMAWTSEDCAILLQVLAGHDSADPASAKRPVPDYRGELGKGAKGLKIGVVRHFFETDHKVSDTTLAGINSAITTFSELGAEVRDISLSPLAEWIACGFLICISECFAAHESFMQTDMDKYGERLRNFLMLGALVSNSDYVQAVRRRRELAHELAVACADLDILVSASQPAEAPRIDAVPTWTMLEKPSLTMPFNVTGYPAMSICTGFGAGGLPISMQLIAKPFQEPTLFRAAHTYEQATQWRGRRPDMVAAGRPALSLVTGDLA